MTYNLTSASPRSGDIFVSKLDPLGNFIWAKSFGGPNIDIGYSIAVDKLENVYTVGFFSGTADFDPNPSVNYNVSSVGGNNIFLNKLDSSGDFVWSKAFGTTESSIGSSIAVDGMGNIYATGWFIGTIDVNPDSLETQNYTAVGDGDILIVKLGQSTKDTTISWTGNISTAWENPENWSGNMTPSSNSLVIIPSGRARYPIIKTNVSIKKLECQIGSSLIVSTGVILRVIL